MGFFAILDARRGLRQPQRLNRCRKEVGRWALPVGAANWEHSALGRAGHARGSARSRCLYLLLAQPIAERACAGHLAGSEHPRSLVISHGFSAVDWLARILMPPLLALAVFIAGRQVGRRASFTRVLRTTGFAQSTQLLQLLAFVPVLGPLARLLTVVLLYFATWMGASTAAELRGWRSLVVPLVVALVLLFVVFLLRGLAGDASFSAFGLAQELGLARSP